MTPKAGYIKEQTDKLEFTKMENFCTSKEKIKKMKSHRLWEIPANYISDAWPLSRTYKEPLQLNRRTKLRNEQKIRRHFTRNKQMANKYIKKLSTSLIIR